MQPWLSGEAREAMQTVGYLTWGRESCGHGVAAGRGTGLPLQAALLIVAQLHAGCTEPGSPGEGHSSEDPTH